MLLAHECNEVFEVTQIHPIMIDRIYRTVDEVTLTGRVVAVILLQYEQPRRPAEAGHRRLHGRIHA